MASTFRKRPRSPLAEPWGRMRVLNQIFPFSARWYFENLKSLVPDTNRTRRRKEEHGMIHVAHSHISLSILKLAISHKARYACCVRCPTSSFAMLSHRLRRTFADVLYPSAPVKDQAARPEVAPYRWAGHKPTRKRRRRVNGRGRLIWRLERVRRRRGRWGRQA